MIAVPLADLHAACGVRWTAGPEGAGELLIDGVTTDSRGDVDGKLFVGIPGPRFDGARFAAAAVKRGARAVLVDAANDKEAKTRGANMLKVKPSDIEATQKV